VILLSSDAEEAGLRGARAFVRRHKAELRRLPTTLLNIDSVYRADRIQFLCSDLNGFVPLDRALADRCVEIAKSLGVAARTFRMYPGAGATDAAEFARAGVRSTTLIALPTDIESADLVYHTPRDTVASIQPAAVEACLGVALGLAREIDEEGSDATAAVPPASTSDAQTPAKTKWGQNRTSLLLRTHSEIPGIDRKTLYRIVGEKE
jgi:Zn-dependent M28 family amino/carboxypeptidase